MKARIFHRYFLNILILAFLVIGNAYAIENITTVRVLIHKGPEANVLRTLIKKYELDYSRKLENDEQNNQYKLRIETVVKAEYGYQKVLEELVISKNAPDLFEVDAPRVSFMVFKKYLKPLEPFLLDSLYDFYPALIDQGTVNGVLYTLPTYNSSVALYYNKDLLNEDFFTEQFVKETGVSGVPTSINDAWSFSQLKTVLIKGLEEEKFRYGLLLDMDLSRSTVHELLTFLYLPIVYSKIDRVMNPETDKFTGYLNHPRAAEALGAFQKEFLHDPDHPDLVLIEPESIEMDYVHNPKNGRYKKRNCASDCCKEKGDYLKAFKNGEAAMLWHGHWQYETLHACLPDKLGIMPLPYYQGYNQVSPFGSYSWAMNIKTEHPALVADLIRYLTSAKTQKKVIEGMTKADIKEAIEENFLDLDENDRANLLDRLNDAHRDEIVLKSGGALPTRESAAQLLGIYQNPENSDLTPIQANPRLVFIRQSENTAIARPKTPAYDVFTYKFANTLRKLARHAPDSTMPLKDAHQYLDDIAVETDRYMKQLMLEEQLK
jgi:ABC-type glycerol-3-phosphate transport system substrate-binding protein